MLKLDMVSPPTLLYVTLYIFQQSFGVYLCFIVQIVFTLHKIIFQSKSFFLSSKGVHILNRIESRSFYCEIFFSELNLIFFYCLDRKGHDRVITLVDFFIRQVKNINLYQN